MSKSTQNTEPVEPSTIVEEVSASVKEVQVLPVPTSEGTSKAVVTMGAEPIVIILQELLSAVPEPSIPSSLKNVS